MSSSLEIILNAVDNASKVIDNVGKSLQNLEGISSSLKGIGGAMTDLGGNLTKTVAAPMVGGLGLAANTAIQFETALAEVAKASGASGSELQAMGQQVLELSRDIPLAATEIAGITAAGARLGVQGSDNLSQFTSMIAEMSVAFDMSSQSAADAAAEIANVFNMRDAGGNLDFGQIEQYGNVVNTLADNMATTEAKVISATQAMSGIASSMGVTADQTAALGAGFTALGIQPGVAANAFKVAMQRMGSATPEVVAGMEALGISVSDFQSQVQAGEGAQAFVDVLDKINNSALGPIEKAEALSQVFGNNYNDTIAQAAAGSGAFADALSLMDQSLAGAGSSMSDSFAIMSQTTASQMQLMKNSFAEIGVSLGAALLPAINSVLQAVTPLARGFAEFAAANPGITQIGLALAGVAAAIGPILIGVGGVVSAIGTIAPIVGTIAAAIGAIASGPVLLVVAAIAAAGALIYANWSRIAPLLQQVGSILAQAFLPVLPAIQQMGASMMQAGMAIMQFLAQVVGAGVQLAMFVARVTGIQAAISGLISGLAVVGPAFLRVGAQALAAAAQMVAGFVSGVAQVIAVVANMGSQIISSIQAIAGQAFSAGAQIIQRLAAGIRSAIGAVTGAIGSVASAIAAALPGSPVKEGVLRILNNIGSNPGAEIVNMLARGIQAAAPTMQSAMAGLGAGTLGGASTPGINPQPVVGTSGGGGGSNTFTFNFPGVTNREEAAAIGDDFEERVRRVILDVQHNDQRVAYS